MSCSSRRRRAWRPPTGWGRTCSAARVEDAVLGGRGLAGGAAARPAGVPAHVRRGAPVRAGVPAGVGSGAGRARGGDPPLRTPLWQELRAARGAGSRAGPVRARRGVHELTARTCARVARQSNSRTSWWAARCGSRRRRNHGLDIHRARDRVSRRAASVAGRQSPGEEPTGEDAEAYQWRRDFQRRLADGGWAAVHWPVEYGGRGATLTQSAIFFEELARARAPLPANVLGLLLAGPTIMVCGTDEQKDRFLAPIVTAEEIWCQGFSEPEAGSDLASLKTRAVKHGRRVGRHRPEGLDKRGPVLQVVHARGPHRHRGAQAQGPHLLPDGHGAGRGAGPAAAPD